MQLQRAIKTFVPRSRILLALVVSLGIWTLLTAAWAVMIFSSSSEPMPMGYWGTFDVFELVGSLFYFGFVAIVLVAMTLLHPRRARESARGFEVVTPEPP